MPFVGTGVPVRLDQAGLDEAQHVGLQREVDEVSRLTRLDRATLVARGAERGREPRRRTGIGVLEGRNEALFESLLRSRVGDQCDLAAAARTARARVVVVVAAGRDPERRRKCDSRDPEPGRDARQAVVILLRHLF